MHLAFATDRVHPDFAEDDRILVAYLIKRGFIITAAVWDDPLIDWEKFDALIFRSVWDYFIHREQFDHWLEKLASLSIPVFNPLSIVHWNKDKTYFNTLKAKGILIPAYEIIKANSQQNLSELLHHKGWDQAVIKPTISGGAYNTWVTSKAQATEHQMKFELVVAGQDFIVQQFATEIIEDGEWSLIFFNKKFSHAVCKKARVGEFRVQAQYGGQHHPVIPGKVMLEEVEALLNLVEEPLLYARVDGYWDKQFHFNLMELELIEPVLFFDNNPATCDNFYTALKDRLYAGRWNP
ncbi:MAG: hypothetical protein SH818_04415 [Saprospiraceae bacterium]|nr:hypothetical protein [Saprospiraceae bacterium]